MIRKMKLFFIIFAVASFLLLLLFSPSPAAPIVFFGEDLGLGEATPLATYPNADTAQTNFLSQLVGVGTEDFEGFATFTGAPLSLVFPGAGTATLQGGQYVYTVTPGTTNGVGRYAISGSNYWETDSSLFNIVFTDPVAAFGFYGIDLGDFLGQVTITYENGVAQTFDIPHTVGAPGGSVIYYGFIDQANPFTQITFGNTGSTEDYFGFDDMTIGSVAQVRVPEPFTTTMLLLAGGYIGLLGFNRRRNRP
ncbi:MAG: PEP-CTERM sorting domain-containing protein [Candidatus Aminicenantes bacterium]|nr:PEP-CTERM sorting domain-containing protein [Candidatus Aminicenantes bacterium]NIQ71732.1 PEP-CTERM sorting domain-containing protein [Candidatus Aminicenantes bacterium]NIT27766.1 PEP-CTERM sorting domain-containing protein [Candidatus Aminicenantes bacterium]